MKKSLLIIVFSFICNYSFAQLTFSKVFYDSNTGIGIRGNSVVQTPDNGYLIAGIQFYGGLVMKLDSVGGQVWKKYYNHWGGGFCCIAPTNDSCYIVAGDASGKIFCMKINSLGDTLWTRCLQTPDASQIYSIQQTYDHGYIMAGLYENATTHYRSTGLMKLDSIGNLLWSKVVTSPGYASYTNTIKQTPDSGYVFMGTLDSGSYSLNAYLIKFSPLGNIQWSKTYNRPIPLEMYGLSFEVLNDGLISLIGGYFPYHEILMKTDFSGNVIWNKAYISNAGPHSASTFHQTKDKGFVISIGGFGILRADSSGNILWEKVVTMLPMEAIETNDNGYLILGNGYGGPPNYDSQFGVVKIDSIGNGASCTFGSGTIATTDTVVATNFTVNVAPMGAVANINPAIIFIPSIYDLNGCTYPLPLRVNEFSSDKQSFIISPNPSRENSIITFKTAIKNGSIEIFNTLGEIILNENIFNESKKEIHLKNISSGIYFVKVFDGEKYYSKKLIVERD